MGRAKKKIVKTRFFKNRVDLLLKFLLPHGIFFSILVGLVSAGLFSAVFFAFALPYTPGETTNPTCGPTDTNCTVTASAVYSFGSNNFSGSGTFTTTGAGSFGSLTLTTTALPVGSGGTGLGSVAVGSILGANTLNTLSAITSASGTKYLKNASGTISWDAIDLSAYVPYTGATSTLNLGSQDFVTTGNVGIGTTAPITLFHVAGQCVTGDTKLRRRRKRKLSSLRGVPPRRDDEAISNSSIDCFATARNDGNGEDGNYIYDEVQIKDIQPGDEVLTLNENTGKLVWSRVNALMDMGVKEIYTLITAAGKTIRTTANHPYYIAPKSVDEKTAVFIDGANFDIGLKYMNSSVEFRDIKKAFTYEEKEPIIRYYKVHYGTNKQDAFFTYLKKEVGVKLVTKIIKKIKQTGKNKADFDVEIAVDAVMLKDNYDTAVLFSGDSDFVYLSQKLKEMGKKVMVIAPWRATARELRAIADVYINLSDMPFVVNKKSPSNNDKRAHRNRLSPALSILEQVKPFVNSGQWIKVSEIKEGEMIAVVGNNGKPVFERIVSIKRTAAEQVYDIEVENTHNFVGNDIIAHNTYISGNVGIGVTAPTAVLNLKAGTTAASTAPLKFTSGALLTAAEAGAIEFLTDAFYGTITTGAARKTFAFTDSNITGNAATATALAADPANCASGGLAGGITAAGVAEACITPNAGTNIANDLEEEVTEGSLADSTIVSADIKDATIVYADIQNVSAASRVLGRITTGAGVIEELTGANLKTIIGDIALTTDTSGSYVATVATATLTGLTGGAAGSEGAAISLAFDYTTALSGDPALAANNIIFGANGLVFEGATADTFETFLTLTDPTTDRTITFPNETGTVCTTGSVCTGYQASGSYLTSASIDTIAELDTIVADANVLSEEEIDASSELLALMDDETGTGVLVFGTAPTFTTSITTPLVIGGTATTADLNLQTTSGVGATGADMHFLVGSNGGTEAMTILNSGNVGIGTTGPDAKLDSLATTEQLRLTYTDGTVYSSFTTDSGGDLTIAPSGGDTTLGSGTEVFTVLSTGNVGIGATAPTNAKLVVIGGVAVGADALNNTFNSASGGTGTTTMYIGTYTINVSAPSDVSVKENIINTGYGLADLMKFSVKDFDYKKEYVDEGAQQEHHTGLIAQDVEQIYPEAIIYRSDNLKAIDYNKLMPLIIKSIQELALGEVKPPLGGLTSNGAWGTGQVSRIEDSSFTTQLKSAFVSLGIYVEKGIATMEELIAQKATIKTARISKMEMVDSATGDIYCSWIENGEWQKKKGECNIVVVVTTEIASLSSADSARNDGTNNSSLRGGQQADEAIPNGQAPVSAPVSTPAPQPSAPTEETNQQVQQVIQQTQQIMQQVQQTQQDTQQAAQEAVQQATQGVVQQITQQATQQAVEQATQQVNQKQEQTAKKAAQKAVKDIKEDIKEEIKQEVKQELQEEAITAVSDIAGTQAMSDTATTTTEAEQIQSAPAEQPAEQPVQPEQQAGPSVGDVIQESAAGLLNNVWDFVNWIFNLGAKKVSSLPFIKSATAGLAQNSATLKQQGLLSSNFEPVLKFMEWLGQSFWRGAVKSLSFFAVQDIKADFLQTFSQIRSTIEKMVLPIINLFYR